MHDCQHVDGRAGPLSSARLDCTGSRGQGGAQRDDPLSADHTVDRPGDTIFTTDLLPDGRIILEIARRTPYQAYENRLRTVVTLGEYIVDLDGGVELMLPKRIGQLAAAGPNGELYFLKTRPALRDGEASQLLGVVVG